MVSHASPDRPAGPADPRDRSNVASTAGTPRIPPGGLRELGLPNWAFSRLSGLATGTTPPNVFTTLGRHRGLFRGWLMFAGRLMPGGRIGRRETEMLIIRVAHLRGSRYEFEHHVRLGRRCGVTAADVDRLVAGPDADGWSPREQALLRAADALVAERRLDDERWAEVRRHLDEREAIELLMLVGHYDMLAMVIETLRLDLDEPRGRRGRLS
ncbi:MAG: carboxymuconolactone decarboxylase family protein [Solirubrobacteraceae bacterium]|nr:carboxymuconolactone decarboxylase family protein [Solirubrobacteraceae bacterium]